MRTLLLASLALIGVGAGGPAWAADMRLKAPVYKAPPPVAAYNWTGCYVGGNAGHIRSKGDVALRPSGAFLDPFDIFSDPLIQDPLKRSYATSGSGFLGGVQIGCNLQHDRLVLGLEVDFNRSSLKETTDAHYDPIGLPSPLAVDLASRTEQVAKSLDWFSTGLARLGFALHDRFLVYGTGGVALARISSTTSVLFGPDGQLLANLRFVGSDTRTRRAAVVGGGAEFAVTPNWSLKAEYLFMNFGAFGYETPQSGPVPFFTPAFTWATTGGSTRVHFARVGLNYKFD
jgi:outer membrane immunogenic protein